MARIRAADTRPELVVRRSLHAAGYRFRLHAAQLPGRPDIVLRRHKAVILVHGCFWHRYAGCTVQKPAGFWEHNLNIARDRRQALLNHRSSSWTAGRGSTLEQLSGALDSSHPRCQEIPSVRDSAPTP
jgi:DNA mismatch endonuclease (patch repair protein)